jgi:hypothetical protein
MKKDLKKKNFLAFLEEEMQAGLVTTYKATAVDSVALVQRWTNRPKGLSKEPTNQVNIHGLCSSLLCGLEYSILLTVRDLEITFVIFSLTPAHSTNNP